MTVTADAVIIIDGRCHVEPFPEMLIREFLNGTLLDRAIRTAQQVCSSVNIVVLTAQDSVRLICERNSVGVLELESVSQFLNEFASKGKTIITISPYYPLVNAAVIKEALEDFRNSDKTLLVPIFRRSSNSKGKKETTTRESLFPSIIEPNILECVGDFRIFCSESFDFEVQNICPKDILYYQVYAPSVRIDSKESWWISQRLISRKRFIFWVAGYLEIGLGHVYRSLTLAGALVDHEVQFVCDSNSRLAADHIMACGYRCKVCPPDELLSSLILSEPDLVVLDILDTSIEIVKTLKNNGSKVVSFEDFGSGVAHTDLTINELYERASLRFRHILWGSDYYFIRDEFLTARPIKFNDQVSSILVTFGGTDHRNFTQLVLNLIFEYCKLHHIKIFIVTGSGYVHYERLRSLVSGYPNSMVELSHATGIMSKIMERVDVAICSNGRTVYELAHMNIPSIVVPTNDREVGHLFACRENGFIVQNNSDSSFDEISFLAKVVELIEDTALRRSLAARMERFNFSKNLSRIINLLENLIAQRSNP